MKNFLTIISLLCMLMLTACNSDSFRLEARFDGIGTQNVQIIYATSEGVQTDWVTVTDERLSYEGYAPELTVLCVLNDNGQPLARMAVKNGDKIEFRGAFNDFYNMQYRGSKVTMRWNDFLHEHAEEIGANNQRMLDIDIEKYIRENPDDVVSTLLLMYDYSNLNNSANIDAILGTIDDKAKPLFLIQTYQTLHNARTTAQSDYFYMIDLIDSTGQWSSLRNAQNGYNLLWFWSRDDMNRLTTVDSIKTLGKTFGKRLSVSDICLDGDTVAWHSTLSADSTKWTHYWAPGGPESKYTAGITTYSTPSYMLVDSIGHIIYRGTSLAEVDKLIKHPVKKRKK